MITFNHVEEGNGKAKAMYYAEGSFLLESH